MLSATTRTLVTGGAGFLGSFLCERLLTAGHEVIALDNFFTGSKQNIDHLFGNSNFELIRHDVVEPILIEVDWIFNLACPASPVHYQYNPVKTVKTSVMGAINMLGLAKRVRARICLVDNYRWQVWWYSCRSAERVFPLHWLFDKKTLAHERRERRII